MIIDKKEICLDFLGRKIRGNIMGDYPVKSVFLHGAGKANMDWFEGVRRKLWDSDISSMAFDFIGHGKSEGNLFESSLKERTDQVYAIVKSIDIEYPINIIGRSMSGYTAIKLTEMLPVGVLILMVPAVYSIEAYASKFNLGFTSIIRRKKSWEKSDAFDILGKFTGKLLIIGAEYDEIIPREILIKLFNSAKKAKERNIYFIPKATHNIRKFLDDNESQRNIVYSKIINIITA